MATSTPYFLWPAQPSSAAASDLMNVFEFNAPEESAATTAAMDMAPMHAPELAEAVARPRLRRQQASSGSGRQQQQQGSGGTPKKPPQRGLGVAELERLRCGGVAPLQDLNVAAAAAMLEAAAAAASAQGSSVIMHHQQDHLPAFDAATGARYYSPLLVQPPPAPQQYVHGNMAPEQAPVRYVHGNMAPEQQYFMDRWGRVGGFAPAGNAAGAGGLMQQLQGTGHEQPSSQNTIWRPAPASSPSCLHPGHRCDLCSKTMRALSERASRAPAAPTTMPADYSLYDLAAAMTAARKETAGVDGFSAREEKKQVREIEFFPTSTASHADESEFATAMRRAPPFSNSSSSPGAVGGYAAPLDLSLRL